jgi:competence protein ComEC
MPNTVAVDAGSRVLIPFFRGEGINHLDMLVISHNDLDHRGGVEAIFQNMAISQFVNSDNDASRFPQKSIKTDFFTCVAGQSWRWDGVLFEVLSPSQDRLANESHSNDRSCVIRAQAGKRSILLTGDAELSVEQELLAQMPEKLPSTLLIAGHHGSRSSTSLAWLERVMPEWTVFSAGYRNRYGHPHSEVLKNLQHMAKPFVRTDQLGAITFELSDSVKPIPLSYREDVRRVWHR